ncbi:MAG: tRNA (adenosine(37)-N6)-dimethylallyltransferase MiaA [Rhodospirillaceae bacterium]|nr:tRNA (adenosine(37)-N6)-dimethylallyltransferase MiaA [Rhodospirillaceae bacterium]MBT4487569.1 tRNA (adenosine(37)-N6)-dimethylallyltransferase MiaA [Rhodospirillaceae bacterium]MBT5194025.1 tRNA (adenosine(37)-N6)-dimethylallyltransferase MiaA [Rhodospirillaceae bacterium]MBT5895995.1 tRNA (adenosine(37)-N6)-dimethylallyltransferase MiaA [Rhodospirillaceae bacterium]MBT6430669.1 tRNA (adenosine(37)-N6)-dimethylallyltransferase MiaA [Rhodospirillaceae bacterium]
MQSAILIAGPTASGKSSLAIELAQALDGVIINADSMQVYRELRVLTARPDAREEAAAPHRLYGFVSVAAPYSAARWVDAALAEIAAVREAGQVPIVVGGTGLYFQALTEGMAEIPEIPDDTRAAARAKLEELGPAGLHLLLESQDPVMAARLMPTDPQRLVRAYEVLLATGTSLADWQQRPATTPVLPPPWQGFVLNWPRAELYRRCDERLAAMLDHGALDEVAELAAMDLDPALPAMKALGVPDLLRLNGGACTRAEALGAAQQATRRYAKRQMTWFRNKMCSWMALNSQDSERLSEIIIPFISKNQLTAPD